MESYYQLIIKITIFEKRTAKLCNKGKICINIPTKGEKNLQLAIRRQKHKSKRLHARMSLQLWMWLVDLNYNFEYDWPIELSDNKVSTNKVSNNKLSDNNLARELVEK